jgi:putative membrane protein
LRAALLTAGAIAVLVALVISGIKPYDRATWWMEVAPVLIAAPILAVTYRHFPLTTLLYCLIVIHALVLILGGAYTYARVPLGFWLQDWLGFERNPYDRIGHFMQGFVPAILVREILIRGRFVCGSRMLAFVSLSIALAFSAFYELIEWWAALALGQGAHEFLGTQGDPWDTQADMFLALVGAVLALATLSRLHDLQIERIKMQP